MKFGILLAILTSTIIFNTASATDEAADPADVAAYCEEQSQLAGIEDQQEKSQYIKDCIDSFGVPSDEIQ